MQKPRDLVRLLHESWNENASEWLDAVRGGRIASRLEGTNDAIVEAVLESGARRILDVGCGEGWLAHRLSRDACEVTGIDASADLIASASSGPGRFIHLSYEAFQENPAAVGGGDFDAVVCNFSLFEEDLTPLLSAFKRCLVREGYLIIQTVHPLQALDSRRYEDAWRVETFQAMGSGFREMPWYYRTLGSWLNVLSDAGFSVTRCREPVAQSTGLPLSLLLICRHPSHPG